MARRQLPNGRKWPLLRPSFKRAGCCFAGALQRHPNGSRRETSTSLPGPCPVGSGVSVLSPCLCGGAGYVASHFRAAEVGLGLLVEMRHALQAGAASSTWSKNTSGVDRRGWPRECSSTVPFESKCPANLTIHDYMRGT